MSGGDYSSQLLGYQNHTPYVEAAVRGGMDASTFVSVMKSWNEAFYPRTAAPVIAATVAELQAVTAPALIFNGNDDFHPAAATEALHEAIGNSRLLPCAWTRDEWMFRYVGRIPGSVLDLYPRMSETILGYIREIHSDGACPGGVPAGCQGGRGEGEQDGEQGEL